MGRWNAIGSGEFNTGLTLRIQMMARHGSQVLSRQDEHLSHASSIACDTSRGEATRLSDRARGNATKNTHEQNTHSGPHIRVKGESAIGHCSSKCTETANAKSTARVFRRPLHNAQRSITAHAIIRLTHADQGCVRTLSSSIG